MTTPQYRTAQRKLDALERSGKLSRQGKDWLIQAVDPYHDSDIEPTGYPDTYIAGNLVQLVKLQLTITKDSTLPAGNWDCMINNLPWLQEAPYSNYTTARNTLHGAAGLGGAGGSNARPVGGVLVTSVASGAPIVLGATSIHQSLPVPQVLGRAVATRVPGIRSDEHNG
jgi:hypothetical protein